MTKLIRQIKAIHEPQHQIDFIVEKFGFVNIFQTISFLERHKTTFKEAYNLLNDNYQKRYKQNCIH